jgi:hypothetical protein
MVAIHTAPIIRLVIRPGQIKDMLTVLMERRCIRKKEAAKDNVIRTMSQENMIHRGAKF